MVQIILIEELHLTVTVPAGLPKSIDKAMQHTLRSRRFQADLRNAMREVFRRHPSLKKAQFRITR
jgi:hypothetical protein